MDIGAMIASGMFGSNPNADGGGRGLTDFQYKSAMYMCLKIAENTHEVKTFRKHMLGWAEIGEIGPHIALLAVLSEASDDMEQVKSVLEKILKT